MISNLFFTSDGHIIDELAKKQKAATAAATKKASSTSKPTQSGTATPTGTSSKSAHAPKGKSFLSNLMGS